MLHPSGRVGHPWIPSKDRGNGSAIIACKGRYGSWERRRAAQRVAPRGCTPQASAVCGQSGGTPFVQPGASDDAHLGILEHSGGPGARPSRRRENPGMSAALPARLLTPSPIPRTVLFLATLWSKYTVKTCKRPSYRANFARAAGRAIRRSSRISFCVGCCGQNTFRWLKICRTSAD